MGRAGADIDNARWRPPTVNAALAAALAPVHLGSAACWGQAPLFDLDVHGEDDEQRQHRHAAAIRACSWCPARPRCEALLGLLPTTHTAGVWAGQVLDGKQRRGRLPA